MAVSKFSTNSLKTPLKYSSLLAGNAAFVPTSYESIATVSVSTAVGSITFSSIPATYTHLQLRVITRSAYAGATDNFYYSLNSDTTNANYYSHRLNGDGASATATAANNRVIGSNAVAGNTATAGVFSSIVIDILDYANTNKYKTSRFLGGYDNNGSGVIQFSSSLWSNTAAVTTLGVDFGSGNIAQYSSFALYGIKGA